MFELEEKVARLVSKRAYIFKCSFTTAWWTYMFEEEKEGFAYEYI